MQIGIRGTAARKSAPGADIVMCTGRMKCTVQIFRAAFAEKRATLICRLRKKGTAVLRFPPERLCLPALHPTFCFRTQMNGAANAGK